MGSEAGEAIEVEGRRLAWRTVGEGPPLLLVNGYAATGEDWDPTFLGALAATFAVICPDNRGVGGSDLGAAEVTVDGMAADLEALLDSLAIDRLPLVGWSMGRFVAQQLALRSPELAPEVDRQFGESSLPRGQPSLSRCCACRRRRWRPGTEMRRPAPAPASCRRPWLSTASSTR